MTARETIEKAAGLSGLDDDTRALLADYAITYRQRDHNLRDLVCLFAGDLLQVNATRQDLVDAGMLPAPRLSAGHVMWVRLYRELVAEREIAPSAYSRSCLDWVLRRMDRIERDAITAHMAVAPQPWRQPEAGA